jgi:hypothetical protein
VGRRRATVILRILTIAGNTSQPYNGVSIKIIGTGGAGFNGSCFGRLSPSHWELPKMKTLAALMFLSFAAASAQNITVEVGARPVGTRAKLNLESGAGIVETCRDEGASGNRITCVPSVNSAIISTHDTAHNNENYCVSTNGTMQYTCRMPYKAITAYEAGMAFVLVADAPCSTSCSLNIDNLGAVNIKKSDGTSDPGGGLNAGEPQWVFYDGKVFRLMGGGARPSSEAGDRGRDSMARRFIASMETMTYASVVTLETTAGDVHKTTTNNAIGNTTINAATGGIAGQHMWVIIVNDQLSGKTVSFGSNFKSAGALSGSPGKSATLQFISDGSVWYEVARTTNL